MIPTVDAVRRVLDAEARAVEAPKHAAVAAILMPGRPGPDLLFIRRAEYAGDPWSGHVAFPGGRVESGDEDMRAAALRETFEETGVDLREAEFLGCLEPVAPVSGLMALAIHPFVFALDFEPEVRPNHEVAGVLRLPLPGLLDGHGRTTFAFTWQGREVVMPCVEAEGVRLWGLTLRIVDDLLNRLDGRGIGLSRNPPPAP
jgi:8-oxo-dGTP pyrophosphatase MutT (NUDIX family)